MPSLGGWESSSTTMFGGGVSETGSWGAETEGCVDPALDSCEGESEGPSLEPQAESAANMAESRIKNFILFIISSPMVKNVT